MMENHQKNNLGKNILPPGRRLLLTPEMGMGGAGGGIWDHFGINLGPFWIHFRTVLGPPILNKYVFQPQIKFPSNSTY